MIGKMSICKKPAMMSLALTLMLLVCPLNAFAQGARFPYSVDFDLRNMDGFNDKIISANDIEAFIQEKAPDSSMLSEPNIGSCFINAGVDNNVNPAFLVAMAYWEGGFGTRGWGAEDTNKKCHNTFGWAITDTGPVAGNCADSWCEMTQRVASDIASVNKNHFYSQQHYTVDQVRTDYATDSQSENIANIMNELYMFSSSIVGEWTLHYHWADEATPRDALITFYKDGTLIDKSSIPSPTGKWTQNGDTITWKYDSNGGAVYDGTINVNMKGTMSTSTGKQGEWSADKRYTEPGIGV